MTQTSNRMFDELARLMTDAANVAHGVRREASTAFRSQAEIWIADLDLVRRDEFDAIREMASKAREENEKLAARVARTRSPAENGPSKDPESCRKTGGKPKCFGAKDPAKPRPSARKIATDGNLSRQNSCRNSAVEKDRAPSRPLLATRVFRAYILILNVEFEADRGDRAPVVVRIVSFCDPVLSMSLFSTVAGLYDLHRH